LIHKPKHLSSQRGMGLPSCTNTSQEVGPSILVTTEVWNEVDEPWTAEGIVIAKPGYRWVTQWEEGKNHTVCEFFDETGELVAVYCDIGSVVTKTPSGFEFDDWYLDVFQPAGGDGSPRGSPYHRTIGRKFCQMTDLKRQFNSCAPVRSLIGHYRAVNKG
jgi:hypothetical protein